MVNVYDLRISLITLIVIKLTVVSCRWSIVRKHSNVDVKQNNACPIYLTACTRARTHHKCLCVGLQLTRESYFDLQKYVSAVKHTTRNFIIPSITYAIKEFYVAYWPVHRLLSLNSLTGTMHCFFSGIYRFCISVFTLACNNLSFYPLIY